MGAWTRRHLLYTLCYTGAGIKISTYRRFSRLLETKVIHIIEIYTLYKEVRICKR